MHCDILIENATLLPLPANGRIQEQGYLTIKDGLIVQIGPMAEKPLVTADTVIEAKNRLLMPGLINGHSHMAMTLFRGLADDLPLMTWLNNHIFPAEARFVTPEMVFWCSKLAAAEMILSGTTTVADGYFHEGEVARACAESGLRAIAAQGIIDFPAPGVPDPANNLQAASEYIAQWQGLDSLVRPALFCHSPYTCGPETLVKAKELSRQRNVPLFIHLAETVSEEEQLRKEHGQSPVAYLDSLGILDPQTICVHLVRVNEEDISLLARSGAVGVSCPESNMKLASGCAPAPAMLAAGVPLALGTDGCASNNDLDLFREMDSLAKLQKLVNNDSTVMPAGLVLEMATSLGAKVLGFGDRLGRLAEGCLADLILVDTDQPHLTPMYNSDLLVYSARGADVSSVIINGRLVMDERRLLTIDLNEVIYRVRELAIQVRQLAR